jgi:hypothetical protein
MAVVCSPKQIFEKSEGERGLADVEGLGNEAFGGSEEALAAGAATGEGGMCGRARVSRMIPKRHGCSLFTETDLRKIG